MDFSNFLLIIMAVGAAVFFVLKRLREEPEEEVPPEYAYGILARAKKEDLESRKKELSQKEELEHNWRFGIRTFEFFRHIEGGGEKPAGFKFESVRDPDNPGNPAAVSALTLALPTEEGEFRAVMYEKKYSPDWLKQIDPTAFFRVVEVQDGEGEIVFRALLRFLIIDHVETFTGTVLDELEHGPWVPALRNALMESEKARGE